MQRYQVEIKDVLNSAEKYGMDGVLTWDPLVFNDNKQKKNKKDVFDCTWIPLKFKRVSGEEIPLTRLKFNNVLLASGAKIPKLSSGENIKNLTISFRTFDFEEVFCGDYAPKEMPTAEEQEKENERAKKRVEELLESTKDFNKAMEIIDLSYEKCCEQLKQSKNLGFNLRKDKKFNKKNDGTIEEFLMQTPMFTLRQLSREDEETHEDVMLKHPLTRIKLMCDKDTERIGVNYYNKETSGWVFTPNVFDIRKIKKGKENSLATVKVNGELETLTVKTAPVFITYKSVAGGVIEFKDIVSSKFGLSLGNRFIELYVKRHKSASSEPDFSIEDMAKLKGDDSETDDESDLEINNEDEETQKKTKRTTRKPLKKEPESESDLEDVVESEQEAGAQNNTDADIDSDFEDDD